MAKKTAPLLPSTGELLRQLGERLRLARRRRRLAAKQVAERAGMAPMTLRSLERGGSGVTMGAYLAVMQVLGIEKDLNLLGHADPVGHELQDARLLAHRKTKVRTRLLQAKNPLKKERTQPVPAKNAEPLHRTVDNSLQEQMRTALDPLPSEKLRADWDRLNVPAREIKRVFEQTDNAAKLFKQMEDATRPYKEMENAAKQFKELEDAAQHFKQFQEMEDTAKQLKEREDATKLLKPAEAAQDWIKQGGFSSSKELADLLDPVSLLSKINGR